jgi:exonuclease III
MRVTVVSWNLARKNLRELAAQLVYDQSADILALQELGNDWKDDEFFSRTHGTYRRIEPCTTQRVRFFTRLPDDRVHVVDERQDGRIVCCRVLGPSVRVLCAAVHLPSKQHATELDQFALAVRYSESLREIEHRYPQDRLVICGDFNMNPFEPGMVSSEGFHAVMAKRLARRSGRIVQDIRRPFFYNPMWSQFGDETPGPPGTYFRSGSSSVEYFWNMFDQVLIRPELCDRLTDVRVLQSIGAASITLRSGRPNRRLASDHLPIAFALDLGPR